jgi:xanthine dehydrogenase YagT iron-sulfur-binding subunit
MLFAPRLTSMPPILSSIVWNRACAAAFAWVPKNLLDESANRHAEGQMVQRSTAQRSSDPIRTPDKLSIGLNVNGVERSLRVAPWTTLLDALRDHLDLTGTKKGCDHGQCGACTVLVDGRRINSCMTLAIMKDGAKVTTIEGLAASDALHPLQQAFIDHDAFQCGYCTSGQICSAAGLIAEGKAKSADEIRELMSGNICRCGAYPNIVAAIQQAMSAMGGKS